MKGLGLHWLSIQRDHNAARNVLNRAGLARVAA